jgi:hypothetical protein
MLSIPTPGVTSGLLSIDVGGRIQKVDLTQNQLTTRRITAEPSHEPYRVREIIPKLGILDRQLIKECAGLRQSGTAFGPLRKVDKLIRRATEIFAGQDYAVIWHSANTQNIPKTLDATPLATNGPWQGAILSIPPLLEANDRVWLAQFLGLLTKDALPTIVPVWPPLCERRTPQLLDAVAHKEHLFAIDSLKGQSAAVFVGNKATNVGANVHDIRRSVLKIQTSAESELKIVARGENEAELLVDLTRPAEPWQVNGIRLGILDEHSLRSSYSLCDSRIADALKLVRQGTAQLVDSSGPKLCSAQVRLRTNGLWKLDRVLECASSDLALQLTSIIENTTSDIQLQFGAYGHVVIESLAYEVDTLVLPRELRQQLLSYLFQFPHRSSQPLNKRKMCDDAIVAAFRRTSPTSASIAYYSALANRLANITTNSN